MSLAEAVETTAAKIINQRPKVLTLDIERMRGVAKVEFWDLSDYKNRRIHPDDVLEWPRTICAAWKWYGSPRVEFAAEWQAGGAERMLRKTWDAYDRADIVVGHNLAAFDTKKLKTGWRDLGLPPPKPWKTIDTLKVARAEFGDESRTLDALCQRLGLVSKTDRYDVEVARAACAGNRDAQRRIRAYNIGDIDATEALYDRLRGWIPNHPHIGEIAEDERRCNQCGSPDLERNGLTRAVVIDYVLWRCRNCGGNVKGLRHSRAAATRGAKA